MHPQVVACFGEPVPQAGPALDDGFVAYFDGVVVDGEDACGGEVFDDVVGGELGAFDAALGVLGAVAGVDQAQEHLARLGLLVRVKSCVGGFRGVGDGTGDAAALVVAAQGEGVAAFAPPGLEQGVADVGEDAGFAGGVGDEAGDESGLERAADLDGGLGDGPAQLVGGHGADEDLGVLDGPGEVGVAGAVAVEVGSHADDGLLRACGDLRDELVAVGEGEDLLELVDDEEVVLRRRVVGGGGDQRAVAVGEQAGAQQGGLAGAGRADDEDGVVLVELGQELGDEPLAAEEPVGVLLGERLEPDVGGVARGFVGDGLADLAPAAFPLLLVAAAGADEREGDGEAGQLLAAGGVGERAGGVVAQAAELAVAGGAGLLAELAQVERELFDGPGEGVERSFRARHGQDSVISGQFACLDYFSVG
ncbi:hypothetical protein BBK82_36205 [Lentzea guizhouensis]|uniref:Uncharacterized protein n=1 Tax=Lentzea guizhouensis TaxID=1586287 RepID=A0A1B2HSC1_9PSEU|nr:hypothetical protein BBK82_36205 [Lentzea guizhouensis]